MSKPWWDKVHRGTHQTQERLIGCKTCPTNGVMPGCTIEWCLKARGEWCKDCKWRNRKDGGAK